MSAPEGLFREAPRVVACPRCGENLELAMAGVQACVRCEGVWLARPMIEQTFGTPMWPPGPGTWWRRELECPVCSLEARGGHMTPISVAGIVVDRCLEHGVWLDVGELGRLLKAPPLVELEVLHDLMRPDTELPPRLLALRQAREEGRARRAADLEAYRARLAAEQARLKAEADRARAIAEAERRAAALAKLRGELTARQQVLKNHYELAESDVQKLEKEVVDLRARLEERDRQLTTERARLLELERQLVAVARQLEDAEVT